MKTTVIDKYILLYNRQYRLYSTRYTILCSHVAPNSVLFAESVHTTSSVHQQGEELLEETYGPRNRRRTSMPPFKFECFGSAA